jgi:fermentation-respiration switch protein FrsA (DUF1100 family)
VLQYLFHPRKEEGGRVPEEGREDFLIPVAQREAVGASLHLLEPNAPSLLFFHGNGEIVSDYDDIGPVFTKGAGVNFFVADYRGYGSSTGEPSVGAMMRDAHDILSFFLTLCREREITGPLSIMGRSLGSAPALELASGSDKDFHSLIIESGFAHAKPLLRVLGLDPDALGFREEKGMGNLDKMRRVTSPSLVIHAEQDHLIPFSEGRALFEASPSETKYLLEIKGANHNDIFFRGMAPYLEEVGRFCRV